MDELDLDYYDRMDWYERTIWRAFHAVRNGTYTLIDLWWVLKDNREVLL